jgi:DNA-directed RNA polymerase specialized sigma24 family protein
VRSASVTGTLAGGAAGPDALMASRGGSSADRAVTELYAMQYRSLVRLAALLVRDVQTAEEVVQDSFAAMHRGWQQLRDADAALAFLRQAVVNRSRSVLRHRPVPGSSLRQLPPGVSGEHRARVARVARALIAVGALDGEVAEQILVDFELALATRQAGSPGQRGPGLGSWMRSSPVGRRPAMPVSSRPPADAPGSAWPQATPGRVVRLGQMIPVRGEDAGGEICLMSYAQTASGPQLSLLARVRYQSGPPGGHRPGGGVPDWPQPEVPFLEQFTATDDRGTRYQMRVRDLGGGPDGWTLRACQFLYPGPGSVAPRCSMFPNTQRRNKHASVAPMSWIRM